MVQINTACDVKEQAASEGSPEGEATERVEPAGGERVPVRSPNSRSPEILPMKKPSDRTATVAAALPRSSA